MFKLMSGFIKLFKVLVRKLKSKALVFHEITEAALRQERAFRNEVQDICTMKTLNEFSEALDRIEPNMKVLIQASNSTMTAAE